jgi:hypothetical protein
MVFGIEDPHLHLGLFYFDLNLFIMFFILREGQIRHCQMSQKCFIIEVVSNFGVQQL